MIYPLPRALREVDGDFRALRVSRCWAYPDRTIGVLDFHAPGIPPQPIGFTLEDPWGQTDDGNGRIPPGLYRLELHDGRNGRDTLQLVNVPGRTHIQIHVGNYPKNTRGCILPGTNILNHRSSPTADYLPYVANSSTTLAEIRKIMLPSIKSGVPCYCLVEDNFDV